jgi:glycerophosphoryl diester phosphodiesterase
MARCLLAAIAVLLAAAAPAGAQNPWQERRVLNIAHQGGEAEAPSNTMYAFETAITRGADMLELDVSATSDGQLVVMHDTRVDRTTNGTGYLTDLTLAQVRRLDAAYDFRPAARYPLRGVRTGDERPPRGFARTDFAVPTLREVLRRFRRIPINIEIKGRDDDPAQYRRNAELLAALLDGTRRRDLIVVSFDQAAVDRFHELAPDVAVAPGVDGIARFLQGGQSPGDGVVALQIPIAFALGGQTLEVTTAESVLQAHRAGYAVHVWLGGEEERRRVYDHLLKLCVDGIMTARPRALERRLLRRKVAGTFAHGTDPCSVRATRATLERRTIAVGLERRGLGPQAFRGTVRLFARGRLVGREAFSLAEGAEGGGVTVALTRYGRRLLDDERVRTLVSVKTRGAAGQPVRSFFRLGG